MGIRLEPIALHLAHHGAYLLGDCCSRCRLTSTCLLRDCRLVDKPQQSQALGQLAWCLELGIHDDTKMEFKRH